MSNLMKNPFNLQWNLRQRGTALPVSIVLCGALFGCDTGTEVKIGTTNSPPTVVILSPGDGDAFDEGSVIHFQAKVTDSYDPSPEIEVLWSSDRQGDLESVATPDVNGNVLFSTANLEVGVHVVTLTAFDTEEASAQTSINLEIIDLPEDPTITIVQPEGAESAIQGDPYTMMVQVWDARDDLDTLDVVMESQTDGAICQTNPDNAGLASCDALLSPGTHTLIFSVKNSAGYDASATAYFEVISLLDIDDDSDGFTENQGDCDDNDPTVNPGQAEVPNNLDDNCNGVSDEGTINYDDDGDGYSENQNDCNDNDPNISPGVQETCGNGIDDNCNGTQDEQNALNCTTYYRDADGDGYGDPNLTECWCQPGGSTGEFSVGNANDCYDGSAQAQPGQTGYFSVHRGDGSFDYNCDNTQSKEFNISGSCNGYGSSIGDCTLNTAGWDGSVPPCGGVSNYLVDNDSCSAGCEVWGVPTCCEEAGPSYGSRQQRCR